MSNITDKQTGLGDDLLETATTAEIIAKINILRQTVDFILTLIKNRNF